MAISTLVMVEQEEPRTCAAAASGGELQVLSLGLSYGTTSNNGNLLSQTIARPGFKVTQYYRYDGANRLGPAGEDGTAPTGDACPTSAVWRRGYITIHTATGR